MKPFESLSVGYGTSISLLDRFIFTRYWRIKLVAVLTFISLLLSTGPFLSLPYSIKDNINWQAFDKKKDNLLWQQDYDLSSNAAKKTFRLTVPVLAKIFHLNNYAVLLLQFLSTILFLYFSVLLVEKITGDSVLALLAAGGIAFIYCGHAGFTDADAWFDEFAYLFLLLAMYSSNAFLIALFVQLASWTDERAFVAGGLVFIWWKLGEGKPSEFNFLSMFKLGWRSSAVAVSLLIYMGGRYLLSAYAGLYTPHQGAGLEVLLKATNFIGLGLWSSLEGFWVLIVIAMLYLASHKKWFASLSILTITGVMLVIAFSVYDITRSAAYIFPIVFVSILVLSEKFSENDLRKILMVSAGISFLFPSYYIITSRVMPVIWYEPVFIRIIEVMKVHLLGP